MVRAALVAAALTASPNPALTAFPVTFEASPPERAVERVEWDFEGDGIYDVETGTELRAETVYADPGEYVPTARFTAPDGERTTATGAVTVRRAPPAGDVGVLLEGGRRATNDARVRVGLIWPPFAVEAQITTDPAFATFVTVPVRASVTHTLDRLADDGPQTVYARFTGGGAAPDVYADDLVLDRERPVVEVDAVRQVGPLRWRLRLWADDHPFGVRRLQLTTDRQRPGLWRPFRARPVLTTAEPRAFVRVRDRAGNASRWVAVALRHPSG